MQKFRTFYATLKVIVAAVFASVIFAWQARQLLRKLRIR